MKKLLKIFTAVIVTICMSTSVLATTVVYQINNPSMEVDGVITPVDIYGTAPLISDSKTLVPLRSAVEALGGEVIWSANDKKITIYLGVTEANSAEIIVDSKFDVQSLEGNADVAKSFIESLQEIVAENEYTQYEELEAVAKSLGGEFAIRGDKLIITVGAPGSRKIEMWVDKTNAYVNGETVKLDVPPQIINSKTMVPIRFISENLGFTTTWVAETKKVIISNEGQTGSIIEATAPAERTWEEIYEDVPDADGVEYIGTAFFDLNNDGVPELLRFGGIPETDAIFTDVYTVSDGNAQRAGTITGFAMLDEESGILISLNQLGLYSYDKYALESGKIVRISYITDDANGNYTINGVPASITDIEDYIDGLTIFDYS